VIGTGENNQGTALFVGVNVGRALLNAAGFAHFWQEKANEPVPADAIRVVALGDSATQAIGADHPMEGFVGRIASYVQAKTGRPVYITNVSVGGATYLGLYMIWRAVQAVSVLREQPGNQGAVIDHIGFNLISLFDGFAIISAIDLHASGWLVAVIAIGAVALGIYAINVRKKTLPRQTR